MKTLLRHLVETSHKSLLHHYRWRYLFNNIKYNKLSYGNATGFNFENNFKKLKIKSTEIGLVEMHHFPVTL